jgi:hypothetical protein
MIWQESQVLPLAIVEVSREEIKKRKTKRRQKKKKKKKKSTHFQLCYEGELWTEISDYVFFVFAVSSGDGPNPSDPSRKKKSQFLKSLKFAL